MQDTQNNHRLQGHLLGAFSVLVWGTTFVATKVLLRTFSPIEIMIARFALGFLALLIVGRGLMRPPKKWHEALFAALIAAVFLKEKLSIWFFCGFVCAMTGITLVSLAGVSELHFSPVGALLTVGAALVWGVYSVLIRVLGHMGYQTVPLTCRIFGYGFLFLLIPTAFEGLPAGIAAWGTPVHLANLLFLGLLASATCFVTWNRAVFLLGPVRTSVYIYASPVITIIASALILHETMTPVMWVGTALALGGLMLSEKKTKKS